MKTVLITGGAGFIGSHTVVELAEAGYRPVVVDNFSKSEPFIIQRIEELIGAPLAFYEQDIQDIDKLKDIIKQEKVSGVIHFAAYKAVGESVNEPLKYYANNVGGLIDLLKVCEESNIKNIVFSSSCTIYGQPDTLPVTEDSPIKAAVSPYGSTKQIGETILSDATKISKTFNSMALRYFNPIGSHSSALLGELPKGVPANLVPFVTQAAAGWRDKLIVNGNDYETSDGSCVRDYIHVVDLAKAHVSALAWLESQTNGVYEVLNIGTGQGSSVLEVIECFEKTTGVKVPYEIGPRRSGDLVSTYASVTKAENLLGWHAQKDLAIALTDAWRWQQTLTK